MSAAITTPTNKRHRTLLGKDPTPIQEKIYANFPSFRGFSDRTLDTEKLEAIVVLALTFGTVSDRVLIFAPVAHEDWVLEQFNKIADQVFAECKKLPNREGMAKAYGMMFKRIGVFGRLLQLREEPPRWVSFGFTADDRLPDWMPAKLLPIDPAG